MKIASSHLEVRVTEGSSSSYGNRLYKVLTPHTHLRYRQSAFTGTLKTKETYASQCMLLYRIYRRCLFSFRKRSLPFLTVDVTAAVGNQFSHDYAMVTTLVHSLRASSPIWTSEAHFAGPNRRACSQATLVQGR